MQMFYLINTKFTYKQKGKENTLEVIIKIKTAHHLHNSLK